MASKNPLRVGIVGGNSERGWARDAHVPALQSLGEAFTIAAVSARNQCIADAAADAFGAERAFGDSLQLVRDPEVDLVAVTVKVPEHRNIVLAALDAGKHVYCEWPLGRDAAEAQEMAAAVRAGTHAMIGLQALASPAVTAARQLISKGAIGNPQVLRVFSPTAGWGKIAPPHYAYLQDKRNGATLETIAGGHTLAMMEELAGVFTEVDARTSILNEEVTIEGESDVVRRTCADHLLVLGKHSSGCVCTLEVASGTLDAFSVDLLGSEGWLRITGGFAGGFQAGNLFLETSHDGEVLLEAAAPALKGPPANVAEAYLRLASDIATGRRTVPDFNRAACLSELLHRITQAAESGTRQTIDTATTA